MVNVFRNKPTLLQIRLSTGIVVGVYVTLHLINHTLGLISAPLQEEVRPYFMWFWHTWPGQFVLYGSLIAHTVLAIHALLRRRHYRIPIWERVQAIVGLAIPYLLLVHITNTRMTRVLAGIDIDYTYEITMLWVHPWTRVRQVILVLLVWGHFAAGLHFWLRIRPSYRHVFPLMLLLYVLVPLASLLGFAQVGKEMMEQAQEQPAWLAKIKVQGRPADPGRDALRTNLQTWVGPSWLALVGVIVAYGVARNWRAQGKMFVVTYPQGTSVRAPVGMSVLEVSRMAGRPHMSVCGGRARCTTCRVLVISGGVSLHVPNPDEARALERIKAPPDLRLACQIRPTSNIEVQPLLNPKLGFVNPDKQGPEFGQELEVTVLFIDIRGSTRIAEKKLPFDVVFLLNHFFEEMAEAVDTSGGYYSNFTGDGLMALFGLKADTDRGAREALSCAASMLERLERINDQLADELEEPLAVGIGIHTGEAIVGRMGPPKAPFVTALGDTVNICARLEAMTKELGRPVVVSVETLDAAGMAQPPLHQVELRGRATRLAVAAINLDGIRELLWMPLKK